MNCKLCDCECETIVCEPCMDDAMEARKVKDENQKLATRIGEGIGKGAFNLTKWVCKGVQQCAPLVKGTTAGAKKAWDEAKAKKK